MSGLVLKLARKHSRPIIFATLSASSHTFITVSLEISFALSALMDDNICGRPGRPARCHTLKPPPA